MPTIEEVIENVTIILKDEFDAVERTAPDSVIVNIDDRPIYLTFAEHSTDEINRVFLDITGEIETSWPSDPNLVEWVVRNGFDFILGTLSPVLSEDGEAISLLFRYRTLANEISADALCVAVHGVAESGHV